MSTRIGGTPEAVDRWVLNRVPWVWCSLPTIHMHLGVFGRPYDEATVAEALERLVARKAVGRKDKGLLMFKRLKEV